MKKLLAALLLIPSLSVADQCVPDNTWVFPATEEQNVNVLDHFKDATGLLLGETHDNPFDHQWQLKMLKQAHQTKKDKTVLVVEMLPTSVQEVLDAWVLGAIDTEQMLKDTNWLEYWSFDFELYRPIFVYAKDNGIRIIAGNTTNEFRAKVKELGWDHLSFEDYDYVPRPASPDRDYVHYLAAVLQAGNHHTTGSEMSMEDLVRFVGNQQLWDVRMAKSVAEQVESGSFPVLLVGFGHLQYGWGIPHQLKDRFGVKGVVSAMAWYNDYFECTSLTPQLVDGAYGMVVKWE